MSGTRKEYKYLGLITGLFAAALVITSTLDTKIFMFGPLVLPAGIILFPLAYVFGDILTEVYGYAASRKVIWTGLAALLLMILAHQIALLLPPAPFWTNQAAYESVLSQVPRIVVAGIIAYFAGEFCNSYILAKLKVKIQGRFMPLRLIGSTAAGQAVDTTIFVLVAFSGVMAPLQLAQIILSGWAFKVIWEVIALPFTIPLIKYLKRTEQEDFYDTHTNFNPVQVNK